MKKIDDTESIDDLINTIEDPVQRAHAMELLNMVLEAHEENDMLRMEIEKLERDIKRLKDRKEKMLGADNN